MIRRRDHVAIIVVVAWLAFLAMVVGTVITTVLHAIK